MTPPLATNATATCRQAPWLCLLWSFIFNHYYIRSIYEYEVACSLKFMRICSSTFTCFTSITVSGVWVWVAFLGFSVWEWKWKWESNHAVTTCWLNHYFNILCHYWWPMPSAVLWTAADVLEMSSCSRNTLFLFLNDNAMLSWNWPRLWEEGNSGSSATLKLDIKEHGGQMCHSYPAEKRLFIVFLTGWFSVCLL